MQEGLISDFIIQCLALSFNNHASQVKSKEPKEVESKNIKAPDTDLATALKRRREVGQ